MDHVRMPPTRRIVMKKIVSYTMIALALVLLLGVFPGCGGETPEVQAMKAELKQIAGEQAMIAGHLVTFDTLDFTVFSNQEWTTAAREPLTGRQGLLARRTHDPRGLMCTSGT